MVMWHKNKDNIVWHGFDELNHMACGAIVDNSFAPGQPSGWNNYTEVAADIDTLRYWGCVGYKGVFGQFGYQIDDAEPVFDDRFTFEAEEGILVHAIVIFNADGARRLEILIPVAGLHGAHTIRALYKSAEGSVIMLNEFTVEFLETARGNREKQPANYPMWDTNKVDVVWHGFDELNHMANGALVGHAFIPGQASDWNQYTDIAADVDMLRYWGSVGYRGAFGRFGYQIDEAEPVFDDGFTAVAEDGIVVHAVVVFGADGAYRMQIMIPVAGLRGEHTIRPLYQSIDGSIMKLNEFVVDEAK